MKDIDHIPSFNEQEVISVRGIQHQISLLRTFNESYRKQIASLSDQNSILKARVEVLMSLLCDAGIPLPPDIE